MSTSLKKIRSTHDNEVSEVSVTVFCGHSDLVTSGQETTRRCVQLTVRRIGLGRMRAEYVILTDTTIHELIAQLQSVVDNTYEKYED